MTRTDPGSTGYILAQTGQFSNEVWVWLGVIAVLGFVLAAVAMVLRRKLFQPDDPDAIGFTLADIRRLHAEGQLSDQEFEQAKARMLATSRAMYAGDDAPAGEPGRVDEGPAAGTDDASDDDSSTDFAPPDNREAENGSGDPDKNPGGEATP